MQYVLPLTTSPCLSSLIITILPFLTLNIVIYKDSVLTLLYLYSYRMTSGVLSPVTHPYSLEVSCDIEYRSMNYAVMYCVTLDSLIACWFCWPVWLPMEIFFISTSKAEEICLDSILCDLILRTHTWRYKEPEEDGDFH